MDIEENLQRLIHQLMHKAIGLISLNGSEISVRIFEQDSRVSLATPVYSGGNYVPKSVRNCLKSPAPFNHHSIKGYLSLDELNFQVNLNYLGTIEQLDRTKFKDLLEEFSILAEEWRFYLDEHDRHDLVYVRVG